MTKILALLMALFMFNSCSTAKGTTYEIGIASWYCIRCNHGTKTSSGIPLSDKKFTCAHKKIANGTKVLITNLKNGSQVICLVTDAGPFCKGRIIDVTPVVAKALGFYKEGLAKVKIEIVK
jgi:rare lipoprotein A